jgi:hypothetical protein
LPFTPSTAGFVPEVIAVIIGKDDVGLVDDASSARAETLLNRSRDMTVLSVFISLLSSLLVEAEITERGLVLSRQKNSRF